MGRGELAGSWEDEEGQELPCSLRHRDERQLDAVLWLKRYFLSLKLVLSRVF